MTPNGVGTPYNLFINSQLKVQLNFPQYVPHALKGQKLLAQGNGHKQHALKGQKLLAQGNGHKQHALKGQKLLAQGSALGYHVRKPVALKGQKL